MSKSVLVTVGSLLLLAGLLFAAQGSGLFPYPHDSFMIDRTPWIWRGLGLALVGLLMVLASRRRR